MQHAYQVVVFPGAKKTHKDKQHVISFYLFKLQNPVVSTQIEILGLNFRHDPLPGRCVRKKVQH